jgi:mono/diheme cytochrome c family protein
MWRDTRTAILAVLAALPVAATADESTLRLTPGDGVERVQSYCAMCHSLDYIVMNSPFQDRAGWEKTVTKMVKVMGAPVPPEDTAAIVDYLTANYGRPPATP